MSGHTKEPWKFSIDVDGRVNIFVDDGRTVTLCHARLRPEDARRIVACVNACAGIPTEDLDRYYNDGGGVDVAMQEAALSAHLAAVKQRDQLLAALTGMLRDFGGDFKGPTIEAARAAVAACGQPAEPTGPF